MGIIQQQFSISMKPEFYFCSLCSFGLNFKSLGCETHFNHYIEIYFFSDMQYRRIPRIHIITLEIKTEKDKYKNFLRK